MTSGASNIINLATMWIPLMPETSQMEAKAREAGERSRVKFEEGFGSGAGQMGDRFADQFANSFRTRLGRADLGLGVGTMIDKLSTEVDEKLARKLEAKLPSAYRAVTQAQNELSVAMQRAQPYMDREAELTERITALKTQHAAVSAESTRAFEEATAARSRSNAVEADWIDAQTRGADAARQANSLLEERTRLERQRDSNNVSGRASLDALTGAQNRVNEAQRNYTELTEAHAAASRKAADASNMLAGVMGGALVLGAQAIVGVFEKTIELGEHLFEGAIEGARELSERLVEVGEDYQHLNIQVSEFSSASGAQLEALQASAARVFNNLDVSGKDVGQTMAVLGSRLGITGEPLEKLTTQVERLQGRFKDLRTNDLATAFAAVGVQGADAGNVLASWLDSARSAGESIGQLTSQIAQLGDTLRPEVSGLSPEQLGLWLSEIQEKVPNGQKVIMGLAHAEQEFAKHNQSFADGLKEAANEIKGAANDADREKLAEELFGSRNWSGALDAINLFQGASSRALHGNADDIDQLLDKWSDLENHIQEFAHRVEGALAPFGIAATKVVETGLNKISGWFTTHHHEFLEKIHEWGDSFLRLLPTIIDVGTGVVSFMGMVGDIMIPIIAGFGQMAAAALIAKGILTGDTKAWDAGDKLFSAMQKFGETDLKKPTEAIDNFLEKMKSDVPGMTKDWDDFNNTVLNTPQPGDFAFPTTTFPTNLPAPTSLPPGYEPHWATGDNAPPAPGKPGAPPSTPKGLPPNPFTPALPAPPGYVPSPGPTTDYDPSKASPSGYAAGGGPPMSKEQVAQAIYASIVNAGYSPQTGLAGVAAANYESSLSPTVQEKGGSDHWGLFQEQGNYPGAHGSAMDQISWFIDQLNSQGGPSIVDQDPANFIANRVERGGYSGSKYDLSTAASLVGMSQPSYSAQRGGQPWFRAPGATEGDNPYHPYNNFRDWLDAKNLGMLMGMWAADKGKQRGGMMMNFAGAPGFEGGGEASGESDPYAGISTHKGPFGLDTFSFKDFGRVAGRQLHSVWDWIEEGNEWVKGRGENQAEEAQRPWGLEPNPAQAKGFSAPIQEFLLGPEDHRSKNSKEIQHDVEQNVGKQGLHQIFDQLLEAGEKGIEITAAGGGQIGGLARVLGFEDGGGIGDAPLYGPINQQMWHAILKGVKGIGRGAKRLFDDNLIGPGLYGKGFTEGGDTGEILKPPWTPEKIEKLHQIAAIQTGIPYQGQGREAGGRGPKDTLPVWVTPNEYIWNDEAVSKWGWLIHSLNEDAQGRGTGVSTQMREALGFDGAPGFGKGGAAGGQGGVGQVIWSDLEDPNVQAAGGDAGVGAINGRDASGGPGSTYSDETNANGQGFAGHHGHVHTTFTADPFTGEPYTQVPAGSQINPGQSGFPDWVYQLGSMYGLRPATYPGHQEWDGANHGIDWWPQDAWDLSGKSNTHEDNVSLSIFADAAIQVSSGQAGFDGSTQALDNSMIYSNAGYGGGGRFRSAGNGHGGGPMYGTPGSPGMPGGPGFPTDPDQMTPQQFDIWKTWRSHQEAIQGKSDHIKDLEQERDRLRDVEIPAKKGELDQEKAKYMGGDPAKVASLTDALQKLNDRLDKIVTRELPKAAEDLKVDQREARQPQKLPGQKDEAGDAAHDFGSKFLGGIAQSLGFPDVFGGKAPWDFGIVKMLGRFTTGFAQGMNREQEGPGYGGGGLPGIGGLPSATSFLDGLSGLKLPSNAFQGGAPPIAGGSNTYATTPGDQSRAPGPGAGTPYPGTGINIGYQDNSLTVHPATDKNMAQGLSSLQQRSDYAQGIAAQPAALASHPAGA